MKTTLISVLFLVPAWFYSIELKGQEYPSHTINNGVITARLYLPNSEKGYYRASRFDWSGIIYELKYKGCDYFGQWYPKHDPEMHDAICGPVEEFAQIGYDEIGNEEFLKIGVGGLRKYSQKEYNRFSFYDITNPGEWAINQMDCKVEFIHTIKDVAGYSYKYTKSIELVAGEPKLLVKHTLENTGGKLIKTEVYNHNFFTIGNQSISSDMIVKFPGKVDEDSYSKEKALLRIDKNKIVFKRKLASNESIMLWNVQKEAVAHGQITIENQELQAGVTIYSETKHAKIDFWASERACCPEPYVNIEVAPYKKISWAFEYTFYVK